MKKYLATLCAIASLSVSTAAQDSVIYGPFNNVLNATQITLLDSGTGSFTTLIPQMLNAGRCRGGMTGPDGSLHFSEWNNNGIFVWDMQLMALDTMRHAVDATNAIMGAPYQPAPNYENVGGFGIFCMDGNGAPAPAPTAHRNSFTVDYSTTPPAFQMTGWFTNTKVPMADCVANPHGSGWLTVGHTTSDFEVAIYDHPATIPNTLTITTVIPTLPFPSMSDATMADDGRLYVPGYDAANANALVMMQVDVLAQAVTTIAVTGGFTGDTIGSIWAEPWENPGRLAYIAGLLNDTVYQLDLTQNPMIVTSITTPAIQIDHSTGRSLEENQLSSWWIDQNGRRNFHVNFRKSTPGAQSVLAVTPIASPSANPLMLSGFEIYLSIDPTITLFGLQGFLPYQPFRTLDVALQADHIWNGIGSVLNIRSYWQAIAIRNGVVEDVSNIINVRL